MAWWHLHFLFSVSLSRYLAFYLVSVLHANFLEMRPKPTKASKNKNYKIHALPETNYSSIIRMIPPIQLFHPWMEKYRTFWEVAWLSLRYLRLLGILGYDSGHVEKLECTKISYFGCFNVSSVIHSQDLVTLSWIFCIIVLWT